MKMTDADVVTYLKSQCNFWQNGQCQTRSCFTRAGWNGKTTPLPEATCEYRRAIELIEEKDQGPVAGSVPALD